MRRLLMMVAILALVSSATFAGSNPGVVLSVHGDVLGVATVDITSPGTMVCDLPMPATCEELSTTAVNTALDPCAYYLVVVVSPPENSPNFNTVTFGLGDYDPAGTYVRDFGTCHDGLISELPGAGWPGPNTGTSTSISPACWEGNTLQPVYYFGVYNYGTTPVMPLSDHPGFQGSVVDCGSPPEEDFFEGYGEIEGTNPDCPGGVQPELGACCFGADCVMLFEIDCLGQSGVWYGPEVCGPDGYPCPQEPTPTKDSTWGSIKNIYR